jgi:hypothetical protein
MPSERPSHAARNFIVRRLWACHPVGSSLFCVHGCPKQFFMGNEAKTSGRFNPNTGTD